MPEGSLERFLVASTQDRLRMVRDRVHADAVRGYLGAPAFAELEQLSRRLDAAHLSVNAPTNVIVVPGVMGSELRSNTKGGVWWIDPRTFRHLNDLRLTSDGTVDADQDNQVIAFAVDPQYEPLLTAILNRNDFGHEMFPYDWRKSVLMSADALRDLVLDVYRRNGGMPVHLVAHSMGGLVVRAALMQHGPELWPVLGKIVFIATPHYGSPAIAGYLKNHLWGWELLALLGVFLSRDTFRSLWGVLGMLPAPRGVYPGTRPGDANPWKSPDPGDSYVHPCANFDLYRAESWDLGLTAEQLVRLQTVLDAAAALHQRMADAHSRLPQDRRDRMLVIAGVGYETLFRVAYKSRLFGLWTDMAKVTNRTAGDRNRDGDGRVPLASAELENLLARYVRGVHGGLPNIPAVCEAVFNFLSDQDPGLATSPREALSSHLGADVTSSSAPSLDGSGLARSLSDPGYWQIDPPSDARLEELRLALEREELPALSRVRLL